MRPPAVGVLDVDVMDNDVFTKMKENDPFRPIIIIVFAVLTSPIMCMIRSRTEKMTDKYNGPIPHNISNPIRAGLLLRIGHFFQNGTYFPFSVSVYCIFNGNVHADQ